MPMHSEDKRAKRGSKIGLFSACIVAALLSAGCGDRGGGYIVMPGTGGPGSYAPIAIAGPDQTITVGWHVAIDGGASYDMQGHPLNYSWIITSKPPSSAAILTSSTSVTTSFTADVSGTYIINLVVNNGSLNSQPDSIVITTSPAGNWDLNASAGTDQYILAGPAAVVILDGSGSWAQYGASFTYTWSFVSIPNGSNAQLSDPSAAMPSFIADREGTYELNLWISNTTGNSRPDTVVVLAGRPVTNLAFRILDAEYSKQLDRIIAVSNQPSNQLHIYDPLSGLSSAVSLTAVPTSISISSDGLHAAVGHAGVISYVNLVAETVEKVINTTADAYDIVLAGNEYAYVFPGADQWVQIHCINISNGTETLSPPYNTYEKTSAKLHPSGTSLYAADNAGISPDDIRKYDISGGTANYLYDSPYHGDYAMCGDLWISEDGLRIFTKCGNVFRSSPNRYVSGSIPDDMSYNGSLSQLSGVTHLSQSSAANQVVAIARPYTTQVDDTVLQWYDYATLTYLKSVTLPHFLLNNDHFAGHGRFVFFNSLGTKVFVILQADSTSGLLNDYGIVTYE
jgi:hypothetical protein